jgi:multidrug efflux pump subunit AcrB
MKRIKAACLEQTIHFQLKDGISAESAKQQVRQEYESYKAQMDRHRTQYKIIDEAEQSDGSLIIKIKKQNNTQPVGNYLD